MTAEKETPDYIGHRQRLRQRFFADNGKSMPDYELLELLLMMAIPRKDVKPIAKELLRKFGSLVDVISSNPEELMEVNGIRENAASLIKFIHAVMERASYLRLQQDDTPVISNWDVLVNHCRASMGNLDVEEFRVLLLDNKLKLIGEEVMQRGTINQVAVHPREVIKLAINKGAASIILAHNHPTGDVTPSRADIEVTKQIKSAAELIDIKLWDHIIVSKNMVFGFKDHGLI